MDDQDLDVCGCQQQDCDECRSLAIFVSEHDTPEPVADEQPMGRRISHLALDTQMANLENIDLIIQSYAVALQHVVDMRRNNEEPHIKPIDILSSALSWLMTFAEQSIKDKIDRDPLVAYGNRGLIVRKLEEMLATIKGWDVPGPRTH